MGKSLHLDANTDWLEGVRKVKSPNMDERPEAMDIELLVIHGISLPPGEFGGPCIDQLFTNTLDKDGHPYFSQISDSPVSCHLLIDRQGVITQYVPFNKRAWHAGESEFNGRHRCNDFSIGIELEGCDDVPYTEDQYQSLALITKVITAQWDSISRDRIVGHDQISPGRKTDPGKSFDWDYYFSLLD